MSSGSSGEGCRGTGLLLITEARGVYPAAGSSSQLILAVVWVYANATENCQALRVGYHSYVTSEEVEDQWDTTRDWCTNTGLVPDAPTLTRYRANRHVNVQTVVVKRGQEFTYLFSDTMLYNFGADDGGS